MHGVRGLRGRLPHDVLGYDDTEGVYKPFHLEEELGPTNCGHGERGCTSCTRACPRFRAWEPEIDTMMFGRPRAIAEVDGISKDIILARASDDFVHKVGQDGGLVSAILIWALEKGYIDAALVSLPRGRRLHVEGDPRRGPHARTKYCAAPAAATPTRPTRWPTATRSPGAPRRSPSSA